MTDPPLRLGIVGAGAFADFIAAAVADLPSVRLVAVADLDVEAAGRLAWTYNAVVRAWPELLASKQVDAVVVATPPATHTALAIEALQAGKHVFCEKPLATTLEDATAVREAVNASGRVLVVDHVLRYNPILRLIGRLHSEGLLGASATISVRERCLRRGPTGGSLVLGPGEEWRDPCRARRALL